MSELEKNIPHITRDQVVLEYRKLLQRGLDNPNFFPAGDPQAIKAEHLLNIWSAQRKAELQRDGAADFEARTNFENVSLIFDAGFTNREYLFSCIIPWLEGDRDDADRMGWKKLSQDIQLKLNQINSVIGN